MTDAPVRVLGRYAVHGEIAAGGMATVHLGRLLGPVGFSKTVAIKRLHPQFAKDPDFVSMFLDEARLAARIQHPNVVSTLDIVSTDGDLILVMEYIEGESLARLIRAMRASGAFVPPIIVGSIVSGMLYGLHAAHEAKAENGEPLGIIHRDVSPQNVLVGLDGVTRVLDFGVAKAANRSQITREGQLKGKLAYMAPEQILEDTFDRRVDIYAAGVVLWEALCAKRLFDGENEGKILKKILSTEVIPPSQLAPGLSPAVDALVMRALSKDPAHRYATAWDFAVAIEEVLGLETPRRMAAFVETCARDAIAHRTARVRQLESLSTDIEGIHTQPSGPPSAPVPSEPGAAVTSLPGRERASTRAILAILAILAAGAMGALGIVIANASDEENKPPGAGASAAEPSAATVAGGAGAPTVTKTETGASTTSASDDVPAASTSSVTVAASALGRPSTVATAVRPPQQTTVVRPPKTSSTSAAVATSAPKPTPPDTCKVAHYYEDGIKKIKPQCLK